VSRFMRGRLVGCGKGRVEVMFVCGCTFECTVVILEDTSLVGLAAHIALVL